MDCMYVSKENICFNEVSGTFKKLCPFVPYYGECNDFMLNIYDIKLWEEFGFDVCENDKVYHSMLYKYTTGVSFVEIARQFFPNYTPNMFSKLFAFTSLANAIACNQKELTISSSHIRRLLALGIIQEKK